MNQHRVFCHCESSPFRSCQGYDNARKEALRLLTQQAVDLLERAERAEAENAQIGRAMLEGARIANDQRIAIEAAEAKTDRYRAALRTLWRMAVDTVIIKAVLERHDIDPAELGDDGKEG